MIKEFRVWDKKDKEFFTPTDNTGFSLFKDVKRFTVEQFTGLKDKKGKKIFEGDILKGNWCPADAWENDVQNKVIFDKGIFGIFIFDYFEPLFRFRNLEVIGNIHENSELLK